jgi:hypothetical protein
MFWLGSSTIVFRLSLLSSCITLLFCHFLGYHFASYAEMQPLVCYLHILEAAIHIRFLLYESVCRERLERMNVNERESENKL